MEEALLARLRSAPAVAAIFGNKVDWLERPEGDALPGATLRVVSPGRNYDQDGVAGFHGPRVRVDSWAATYGEAKRGARALRDAIEPPAEVAGIKFSRSFQDGERDLGPDDTDDGGRVFRVSMDFFVWWKRAQ